MLLITETMFNDVSTSTELNEETGKKSHFIEGIFMQGAIKNRNGRVYPTPILEGEMNRYNKDFVKENRALGELGHPAGPQINQHLVSHVITQMHKEGDNFIGKAKVLDTPMGKILKTFIDEGIKTGVSTRGLGSVKPGRDGLMEVQNDFHLAAVDSVSDPSAPAAFVRGIMENTEYYYDIASGNWRVQEQLEETVQELKQEYTETVREFDEKKAHKIFESFIASLSKK